MLSFIINFKIAQDMIFTTLEQYQNLEMEEHYKRDRELSVSDSQEDSSMSDDMETREKKES